MSATISWAKKVQLAKCDISVGFPKSSHKLLFVATNTPLDDYDTDIVTEENDDSRQPKEKKLAIQCILKVK